MEDMQPTTEDTNKLHNEVNQYINHRFFVVMTTVTAFAAITGFVLSSVPSAGTSGPVGIRPITPTICLVANSLYLVLFLMTELIFQDVTMLTSYLRISGAAKWQAHYRKYEDEHGRPWSFGYRRTIVLTFLAFTFLTLVLPFILAGTYGIQDSRSFRIAATLHIMFSGCCLWLMVWVGIKGKLPVGRTEADWDKIWTKIKKSWSLRPAKVNKMVPQPNKSYS